MKILFSSLLRIGDLITHWRLIQQYRIDHPSVEVHLLVNDTSESFAKYLLQKREIAGYFIVPRDRWQTYLIEPGRPPMRTFFEFQELVATLAAVRFDKVYELSHSLFAARLLDALPIASKIGVRYENGRAAGLLNRWSELLNEDYSERASVAFHSLHVLAKSLDLVVPVLAEPRQSDDRFRDLILLQISTSDTKKQWSMPRWVDLTKRLRQEYPTLRIQILAAPGEAHALRKSLLQVSSNFSFAEVPVVEAGWSKLDEMFQETRLLISLDTSVLHFAAALRVPTLSFFIGSANPQKTAPYQNEALILSGRVSCSPCRHRDPCHQPQHLCAEALDLREIVTATRSLLDGQVAAQSGQWRVGQSQRRALIYKVTTQEESMEKVSSALAQMTWQIYLDGADQEVAAPVGSGAHTFLDEHASGLFAAGGLSWLKERLDASEADSLFLEEVQSRAVRAGSRLVVDDSSQADEFEKKTQDLKRSLNEYLARQSTGDRECRDFFFQLRSALSSHFLGFVKLRRVTQAADEARRLLFLEQKFVRTLINEITERGPGYVAGFGKTSHDRSATT